MYELKSSPLISILILNQINGDGTLQRISWIKPTHYWDINKSWPKDLCDTYKRYRAYSNYDIDDTPICTCLKGFKEISKWKSSDYSRGCVLKKPLKYAKRYGYVKYSGVKLSDTSKTWVNKNIDLKVCKVRCLANCSCMAYPYLNINDDGSSCVMWLGDILVIQQYDDLYNQLPTSEIGYANWAITVVSVGTFLLSLGGWFIWYQEKVKSCTELKRDEDSLPAEVRRQGCNGRGEGGRAEADVLWTKRPRGSTTGPSRLAPGRAGQSRAGGGRVAYLQVDGDPASPLKCNKMLGYTERSDATSRRGRGIGTGKLQPSEFDCEVLLGLWAEEWVINRALQALRLADCTVDVS
ncbi:hypothetical protein GIB67_023666 [Kingdonia uniflora]|uniref:Apple domain-containing protein n=1 Tax=Kingdonia uniflora TaxID=39325 RepID=A0A7J7MG41_9MAGN|nr:hypothetical protein GIB67_023666 [Kingdonia uniflora]